MIRAPHHPSRLALALALASALSVSGCSQFGSRQRLDESRRIIQTLRTENDQIKGQMMAYRNQNQDYSERAIDDSRRLAYQNEAIERLERSVQAYQSERDDLETAFRELRDNLPASIRSASSSPDPRAAVEPKSSPRAESRVAAEAERLADSSPGRKPQTRPRNRIPTEHEEKLEVRTEWVPAASDPPPIEEADAAAP